jgi:hypothetical protein
MTNTNEFYRLKAPKLNDDDPAGHCGWRRLVIVFCVALSNAGVLLCWLTPPPDHLPAGWVCPLYLHSPALAYAFAFRLPCFSSSSAGMN